MSRIYTTLALFLLAVAVVSGSAAEQQVYSGTVSSVNGPAGATKSFSLGGTSDYHITPVSFADGWRLMEMGISRVSVPSGSTAYVIYSPEPLNKIGAGTSTANAIVFGPAGFAGKVAWGGKGGNVQEFPFTGSNGQFYLITQLSGGTQDHVVVSFD